MSGLSSGLVFAAGGVPVWMGSWLRKTFRLAIFWTPLRYPF